MRKLHRAARWTGVLAAGVLVAVAGFVGAGHASGSAAATTTAATTATTGTISTPAAPQNTSTPTISGTPQEKQTLTANPGTWQSATDVVYAYAWQRCDATGAGCAAIPNAANSPTYPLTAGDVGKRVRVNVTATNAGGSSSAASAPTDTVSAAPNSTATIAASDVNLPDRLIIDRVQFKPNPVRSRSTIVTARYHVSDTSGRDVSGALVYMLGIPYERVTHPPEVQTGADGWANIQFKPTRRFPIVHGGELVIFVRARTPQGNLLAGSSTRRLVQLGVTTP